LIAFSTNKKPFFFLRWEIAPEIAGLRMGPAAITQNLTVEAGDVLPLALPQGASGDAIEIMMNFR